MTSPLWWRGTKEPRDEGERGEWKSWLKTQHSKNKDHDICSHHFMRDRWGNNDRLDFWGSKITADGDCSHEIKRRLLLGRKAMTNLDSILKSRDITWLTKVHKMKAMAFPSSSVWMWELDDKESWALKNWCFWPVVLEKTLQSPLDCKEIKWSEVKSLSCVWLFETLWTVAYQAPLSMGFSRQE